MGYPSATHIKMARVMEGVALVLCMLALACVASPQQNDMEKRGIDCSDPGLAVALRYKYCRPNIGHISGGKRDLSDMEPEADEMEKRGVNCRDCCRRNCSSRYCFCRGGRDVFDMEPEADDMEKRAPPGIDCSRLHIQALRLKYCRPGNPGRITGGK